MYDLPTSSDDQHQVRAMLMYAGVSPIGIVQIMGGGLASDPGDQQVVGGILSEINKMKLPWATVMHKKAPATIQGLLKNLTNATMGMQKKSPEFMQRHRESMAIRRTMGYSGKLPPHIMPQASGKKQPVSNIFNLDKLIKKLADGSV